MNESEYIEINRLFYNKFNTHTVKTGRPPTTCYISQATWYGICCHFGASQLMIRKSANRENQWNGLPVVRVMDENYFELR